MGGSKTQSSKNQERDASKTGGIVFNSLVDDQHVNPDNEKHMELMRYAISKGKDEKEQMYRIRGLKEDFKQGDISFARVEVLCF